MKRETALRELRMGCGESLAARLPLASPAGTKLPPAERVKRPAPKKGGGRQ